MKSVALIMMAAAGCSAVQLNQYGDIATKWDEDHPHPGFPANWDDFEGKEHLGTYTRSIPKQFDVEGAGGDQFMWSMYQNYALEKTTADGKPTGRFVLTPMEAKMAAYEILSTHMGLKGKAAEDYLAQNFQAAFDHFDTAATGEIEVERAASFFRYLTGNMAINLH